ncbi:hypothetical protein scyTo_0005096 [Scyliorhinus torazame]|uniref:CCHC-type domain-containing protein n=1 Tax=Scyliorhinus torazame TaxID=75743 RepID=A0A401P2D2_SCYTO|nr:hypothetical protein [Scyliorhinus torazame]
MEKIQAPPQLRIFGNLGTNWWAFKQRFLLYIEASDLEGASDARKVELLLSTAGDQAIQIFNSLNFTDGQGKTKFKTVLEKFDSHCEVETNKTFELYIFQQNNAFRIVFEVHYDYLREQLLKIKHITLPVAIETCIVHEHARNWYSCSKSAEYEKPASHEAESVQAIAWMQCLSIDESGHFVHFSRGPMHAQHERENETGENQTAQVPTSADRSAHVRHRTERNDVNVMTCLNCGTARLKRQCPAKGRRCLNCGKPGHYAALCRSAPPVKGQRSQFQRKRVQCVQKGLLDSDPGSTMDQENNCLESPYRVGIITTCEYASSNSA